MKRICIILIFSLAITLMQVRQTTVNANGSVELVGFRIVDSTVVNGTVQVSFQILSETPVESVVISYINYEEKLVNATLSLTEGDTNDGWWSATIKPKVFEEKVSKENEFTEVTKSIRVEKLYILLIDKTIAEKPIGTIILLKKIEKIITMIIVPWLFCGILWAVGTVSAVGIIILDKRIKSKRKEGVDAVEKD